MSTAIHFLLSGLLLLGFSGNQAPPPPRGPVTRVANGGNVQTLAGSPNQPGYADGQGAAARFNSPQGVAVGPDGTVYVADQQNHVIRRVAPSGRVSLLAGTAATSGDYADGRGAVARFGYPSGVAVGPDGTVYVADKENNVIRRITPAGLSSTWAGSPYEAGSADGAGHSARFNQPSAIAVAANGTVFVADYGNHSIRRISAAGVVSTLAGRAGQAGYADGRGAAARFRHPGGVAVGPAGTVYVADSENNVIRRISPTGTVSTLAGSAAGNIVASNTDGPGAAARFQEPQGVAVGRDGTVYVADTYNHTLRRISPQGMVSTLAGRGGAAGSANGRGPVARFNSPASVALAPNGTLYLVECDGQVLRVVR